MEFASFLQADLTKYADESETGTRFLAMLAGPFYPILHVVAERSVVSCLEVLNVGSCYGGDSVCRYLAGDEMGVLFCRFSFFSLRVTGYEILALDDRKLIGADAPTNSVGFTLRLHP